MSERVSTAGTVEAFRIFGVPVRFHFTFLLLLVLLVVTDLSLESSGVFALFLAGLFCSVLFHDLAHAWTAAAMGVRTLEIVMLPIGGLARYEHRLKPLQELIVSLAGPISNLLISGSILGYMMATHQVVQINLNALLSPSNDNVLQRLAFVNLLLAAFNLLPAFPMDGGRVLRALLSMIRSPEEATRTAAWVGRMIAISMGLYGLFAPEIMLVFVAFFIWMGAVQESTAALGRSLTRGIPVRAAMITEFHRLGHGDTIRNAINLLLSSSQQDFPVLHGDEVIGLLDRATLLKALAADGPDAYVAGVMDRNFIVLDPSTDLAETLPLMARKGRCAMILESGQLIGLLTTENLSEFLLLRRYGMEPVAAPAPLGRP